MLLLNNPKEVPFRLATFKSSLIVAEPVSKVPLKLRTLHLKEPLPKSYVESMTGYKLPFMFRFVIFTFEMFPITNRFL